MSVISKETAEVLDAAILVASKKWGTEEEFKARLAAIERACEDDEFLRTWILNEIIPDAATLRSVIPMMMAMGHVDTLAEVERMVRNKRICDAVPGDERTRLVDEATEEARRLDALFGAEDAIEGGELLDRLSEQLETTLANANGADDMEPEIHKWATVAPGVMVVLRPDLFPGDETAHIGPPPVDTRGDDDETIDREATTLDQELEECDLDDSDPEVSIQ